MSTTSPLGAYHPGTGPLHRLRPGAKLLGLFAFATAVVVTKGVLVTAAALVIAFALTIVAGLRGRDLWRVVRGFAFVAVPLFVFATVNGASEASAGGAGGAASSAGESSSASLAQWLQHTWQNGWHNGFEVVGGLLALILTASALTASTAAADMLDTIAWALRPLRPLGVDPDRVALAFSLVIRSIPSILGIARETRAAAKARGLERNPRALVIPLVLRTVAHAHLTGEALAARGIGEDDR
ncbi:MAG: energy-coupling factor transporter transmembrane component T family protein [Leucobacter sp.]